MKPLDSRDTLIEHASVIRRKPPLKALYLDFYREIGALIPKTGTIVELGSGGGIIKEVIPRAVTSDVIQGPGIDRIFRAERMPFRNGSVAAFVMLNVFHHIKQPEKALREMERCLKPGGKIVMIEPWNTAWSRFVYQNFHHEDFDTTAGWNIRGAGRLTSANGAIPWIIFHRDKDRFQKKFTSLKLTHSPDIHTPVSYILSGGLSKPSLVPYTVFRILHRFEKIWLDKRNIGLFATIALRKQIK